MLHAVQSVVVDVTDLESALRDYAILLGRTPAQVGFDPAQGTRTARFVLSNTALELRAIPGRRVDSAAAIGFRVSDGLAGLRLAGVFEPGARLGPGCVAGPSVPIELVGALGRAASAPGMDGREAGEEAGAEVADGDATGADVTSGRRLEPEARIDGLDHVVIASPDPERTSRHLAEDLGLRLALDRRFPERGLRLIFFRLGGVTLEIASPLASAASAASADAFHGLAWKVSRFDALHARLGAAGIGLSEIRAGHKPGTRVASLRGALHGVPTLLIEHPPRAAADLPGEPAVSRG